MPDCTAVIRRSKELRGSENTGHDKAYLGAMSQAHVLPRFPDGVDTPASANRNHLYAAQSRKPGVRAVYQSVRLPGRSRVLRRLPFARHTGSGTQPDGNRAMLFNRRFV